MWWQSLTALLLGSVFLSLVDGNRFFSGSDESDPILRSRDALLSFSFPTDAVERGRRQLDGTKATRELSS